MNETKNKQTNEGSTEAVFSAHGGAPLLTDVAHLLWSTLVHAWEGVSSLWQESWKSLT